MLFSRCLPSGGAATSDTLWRGTEETKVSSNGNHPEQAKPLADSQETCFLLFPGLSTSNSVSSPKILPWPVVLHGCFFFWWSCWPGKFPLRSSCGTEFRLEGYEKRLTCLQLWEREDVPTGHPCKPLSSTLACISAQQSQDLNRSGVNAQWDSRASQSAL